MALELLSLCPHSKTVQNAAKSVSILILFRIAKWSFHRDISSGHMILKIDLDWLDTAELENAAKNGSVKTQSRSCQHS